MRENQQPRLPRFRGVLDELVWLIIGGVIGAILEVLFQRLPVWVLIIVSIFAVIIWLVFRFWGYLRVQWWSISFAVGFLVGAIMTLLISQGVVPQPRIVLFRPTPTATITPLPSPTLTPTITPSPTAQPPCPSLPEALPTLAPITLDNVGELQELSLVSVSRVLDITLSDNGQWLAVATGQGVCLYDWKTMQGRFRLFQTQVTAATFSPDGHLLAIGNADGNVGVWDTQPEDIQVLWSVPAHRALVTSLTFSPNNRWLASASMDHTVRLWEARHAEQLAQGWHEAPVNALAFSFDGHLASGSNDGKVQLWDTQDAKLQDITAGENPKLERFITDHEASVTSLAFCSRTEWLATASEDRTIRIWNTRDGVEVRRLVGHLNWVLSVNFSPDGRLIVSGSEDKTVRLWEADTGAELRTLNGHTAGVYGVAFSPDGKLLISGSGDGTVRLWGVLAE